jgi:hypothetical protein
LPVGCIEEKRVYSHLAPWDVGIKALPLIVLS